MLEGGLRAETYMPRFSFYHQLLAHEAVFWILMGRSLLIRDRVLVCSDVFMSQVGDFCGGLEAKECLSKNEIKSDIY
jgi:hypothetical protein